MRGNASYSRGPAIPLCMEEILFYHSKNISGKGFPHKLIMVVEDDTATSDFLTEVLTEELHYYVLHVSQGEDAVEITYLIKPDLFIFDYRLPGISGIDLYDSIYGQEVFKDVPCILMSAGQIMEDLGDRKVHVMTKPFDLDELLESIRKLLELDNTEQARYTS